ncbi:reverse transcriptase domain-containing protein [Tanacetum coccineum]
MPPKITTTPMSDAAIKALVARSVADALAEHEANKSRNGDDSHDSRTGSRRTEHTTRDDLMWWNSHVKTVGHNVAYGMTWKTLMKMLTDNYSPRGEIKKLEIKMWNLKVKGTDVESYTQRFQELALMCGRMFPEESDQVEKQNVARAYTAGPGEKKVYGRSKPLCPKCNYHHNGQCAPKCNKCKKVDHLARDCRSPTATANNQRSPEANQRVVTCFECVVQGHYKKDCPKLKNNNRGNQARNGGATTRAYAMGNVGKNPDANVVTSTFLLNNRYASILFDTGVDRSFVATAFSSLIETFNCD